MVESQTAQSAELLRTLSIQATADPAEFFLECMRQVGERRVVDWEEVERRGLGRLVRKVTQTRYGDSVELHDSQKAIELILRARGVFVERSISLNVPLEELSDEQLEALAAGKPV